MNSVNYEYFFIQKNQPPARIVKKNTKIQACIFQDSSHRIKQVLIFEENFVTGSAIQFVNLMMFTRDIQLDSTVSHSNTVVTEKLNLAIQSVLTQFITYFIDGAVGTSTYNSTYNFSAVNFQQKNYYKSPVCCYIELQTQSNISSKVRYVGTLRYNKETQMTLQNKTTLHLGKLYRYLLHRYKWHANELSILITMEQYLIYNFI